MLRYFAVIFFLGLTLSCAQTSKKDSPKTIDEGGIQEAIGQNIERLSDCYRTQLKADPELRGKLVLQWDINKQGKAREIKVVEPLQDTLDSCVIEIVKEIPFPKPPKDQIPRIVYPFEFTPEAL